MVILINLFHIPQRIPSYLQSQIDSLKNFAKLFEVNICFRPTIPSDKASYVLSLNSNYWNLFLSLHKICEDTGFQWHVFSHIRTENTGQWKSAFLHILCCLYFLVLLFYLLIISYCKVKPTFHGCNYFIFERIRRKCSMFKNANFYRFRLTIEVLLIYFC